MQGFLNGSQSQEESNEELCPSLSMQQRVIGFGCSLLLGGVFAILSWVAIINTDYIEFGVFITLSNCCAIGGSMFLAGPKKQAKKMFEETRWIATSVYLFMMILTLIAAFAIKIPAIVIIACIFQYIAMIWYGLSYIPYARTVIKNCIKGIF